MTYPQPNSNTAVLEGSNFFRLETTMLSPGDIYESQVSCKGVALGPRSDIDIINVAYFNDQMSGFMAIEQVSAGRLFVGRLDARNESSYSPSGVKGRILFWSDVVFDPFAFQNDEVVALLGDCVTVKPRFDIIQYFTDVPSVAPERSDRTYYFESLRNANSQGDGNQGGIILPYYGRRYGSIRLKNQTAAPLDYNVIGMNYTRTALVPGSPFEGLSTEIKVLKQATVLGDAQEDLVIQAGVDGMFDAIGIAMLNSGGVDITDPIPINVRFSDRVGG